MFKMLSLVVSHTATALAGFALGIYMLPILMAPSAPSESAVQQVEQAATYRTAFSKDRADSDVLHWGEGDVFISAKEIAFSGELAPGPAYKLYLSPVYVETEAEFTEHQSKMLKVGDIATFDRFVVPLGDNVDLSQYNSVIVWCESFDQYITSAQFK